MTFLTVGLNAIRDAHAADIDKAWVGTNGVAVVESQTGLVDGVTATKLAVTKTTSLQTNTITYTLPSTVGIDTTYREFAVIDDGTVEFNRLTFTGIGHTSAADLICVQTMFYRNP